MRNNHLKKNAIINNTHVGSIPAGMIYRLFACVLIFIITIPAVITMALPMHANADEAYAVKESFYYSVEGKMQSLDDENICDWGGISDLFVWVSIMQLKEEGLLDLEASALNFLPDDFKSQVGFRYDFTILDLMNHTAGFQANQAGHILLQGENFTSLSEWLITNKTPQIHESGEYVAYSDYGVTLAAYIVENVTGIAYYDYVHENILKPANMTETAVFYDHSDNDYVSAGTNSATYRFGFYPSNSARGTMADMAKFVEALISDEDILFKPETRDEFFTCTLKYRDASNMGDARMAHGLAYYYEFNKPVYGMKFQDLNGIRCLYISEDLKTYTILYKDIQNWNNNQTYDGLSDIFGDPAVQTDNFHRSIGDMAASYVKADTVVSGIYSFSSLLGIYTLKNNGDNTLSVRGSYGTPYITQISNDVFETIDGEYGHFYYTKDGKVLEFPYFDLITYPGWLKTIRTILLVFYYIGLVYSSFVLPISLIVLLIRAAQKSEEKYPRFHKYHIIQCGAFCFHGIVFHMMEISYMMGINSGIANASKIMFYIGTIMSVVYWMFFLRSGRKEESSVFNKVLYWATGVFAVVQVVFSFAFGLILTK